MLSDILKRILREYPMCRKNETFSGNSLGTLVRRDLVDMISATASLGVHHVIKGSVGQGKWATVPWVAIMDTRLTKTTQSGIYIVYLFAGDGSSLYLTLNQGCTDIIQKKGRNAAHKEMVHTAHKVRMKISTPDGFTAANNITLGNDFYESGCIFYKEYKAGCLPNDETLIADLRALLDNYVEYCELTKSAYNPVSLESISEVRDEVMYYEHRSDIHAKLHNNERSIKERVPTENPGLYLVDFSKPQLCQETYPVSCIINGNELFGKNWARLLVAIAEMFIAENNPNITSLYKQGLFQRRRSNRPFIMDSRIIGLHCAQLSNGYWINLNYSIPRLVHIIGRLFIHCGISLDGITITYASKSDSIKHETTSSGGSVQTSGIDTEALNTYIRQQGLAGTTSNDIITALNLGSRSALTKVLNSETDIIALPDGKYIHRNNVVDLDEAAEALLRILQTQFHHFDGYSNYRLLFDAARINLSLFMNDNAFEDVTCPQ